MTFDLNEGHHHLKLASAVLLIKFGSRRALFNIFDPRGPRGPGTPYPCKTFVAIPHAIFFSVPLFGLRIFLFFFIFHFENLSKFIIFSNEDVRRIEPQTNNHKSNY